MVVSGVEMAGWLMAVLAGGVTVLSSAGLIRWRGAPAAQNHRGRSVPVVLGLALVVGAGIALALGGSHPGPFGEDAAVYAVLVEGETRSAVEVGTWLALAAALVFAAGFVDDLFGGEPRGLGGHLRAVAAGRITTGLIKLVVSVISAVVVVAMLPRRGLGVDAASVVAIAGSTNVWNGLDVAPGRAAKWFVVTVLPLTIVSSVEDSIRLVPVCLGGVVGLLVFDLRERAMLGDGGSNLMGFVAGLGLVAVLEGWAVIVCGLSMIALNVVGDTVTLSRIIDAVAPLRWFDRLGRLPGE